MSIWVSLVLLISCALYFLPPQESQETLLPPSTHIYPKKKVKTSQETGMDEGVVRGNEDSNGAASSGSFSIEESQRTENGRTSKYTDSMSHVKNGSRSSSPYPSVCSASLS